MSLESQTIGPYQVHREIGRGGMGVVYLGHDTRLDRAVAIKTLPEDFAHDPERLTRFDREAKTLAQLNHPNIAAIHAIEEHDGQCYLVLEYVEGDTLEQRLQRGPLPLDEALDVCMQIAAGLEAAHDAGVIHRDLKPANVKILPDGQAKVLDFGLARAELNEQVDVASPTVASPVRDSPTIPGAIMGSPPYMSPEQARGRTVDRRSDIWTLGVVLYECLTGLGVFHGDTPTDCIAAILHKEIDLSRLPPLTPAVVRRLLERCLARDRNERLRDAGDARLELAYARRHLHDPPEIGDATPRRTRMPWVITGAAAIVAAAAFAALLLRREEPAPRLIAEILPPAGTSIAYDAGPPALSPDGRFLAFVAVRPGSHEQEEMDLLIMRDLETGATETLDESPWIRTPYWSEDGRFLAYASTERLMVIEPGGGRPELVSDDRIAKLPVGGDWTADGRLLYGGFFRGALRAFDHNSGAMTEVLDPFPDRSGDWPVFPDLLPDGDTLIFTNQDDVAGGTGLYVGSLSTGQVKMLLGVETNGRYVPEHSCIVYWRAGSLYAHAFSVEDMTLVGEPTRVASDIRWATWPTHASFAASGRRLAYLPAPAGEESELVLFDRGTGEIRVTDIRGSLWSPEVSNDGRRLAIDRTTDRTSGDIAIIDLQRLTESRITSDPSNESATLWSPDDTDLYFFRGPDVYRVAAGGATPARLISDAPGFKSPSGLSPDGRTMLVTVNDGDDSVVATIDVETGDMQTWLENGTTGARFSPDGRWVAHNVHSAAGSRIAVTNYPSATDRFDVSGGFGVDPRWCSDGREILFRWDDRILSIEVDFDTDPPTIGTPELVVEVPHLRGFDVSPDGRTIAFIRMLHTEPGDAIRIVDNWMRW